MKRLILFLISFCSLLFTYGQTSPDPKDYIIDRFIDARGKEVVKMVVPGKPPDHFRMPALTPAYGDVILSDVPGYDWSFGCSATSAAMIAGYYDRTGYSNVYSGPTNGGVAPMDNSCWGSVIINGELRKECPISATSNGLDGRITRGHVDDYWVSYGSSSPDPYITNGWTQHTWGDCTGDFMCTNQYNEGNSDGSTTFWFYPDGTPFSATGGNNDGTYGLKQFFLSRGYTVTSYYNQFIYGYSGNTQGFTFNNYKQEIDAGRPVLIQVAGHTMCGYGYNNTDSTVYLHDTWDYSMHSMTWGGSYSGMQHFAVSVISLTCDLPAQPGTISGIGSVCAGDTGVAYSIPAVPSATGYSWTLPSGAILSSGANTNSITVNFPSGASSGNISVYASNSCGNGPSSPDFPVIVNPLPIPAITGDTVICIGSTGTTYTTESGMTNYDWSVSAGGSIFFGEGTNQVTVMWNNTGAQTVSVNYTNPNSCSAANPSILSVEVNPVPIPSISGPGSVCQGSSGVYYTTESGMTGYDWVVSPGGNITSGAGTNQIAVTWNGTGAQSVSVNYFNSFLCSAGSPTVMTVIVNALPDVPDTPEGPDTVDLHNVTISYYTIPGAAAATSYSWELDPSVAGIISGTGTTGTVTWDSGFSGAAYIKARSENSCGESSWSGEKTTLVVKTTAGIEQNSLTSGVHLYPNPADDFLTLEYPGFNPGQKVCIDLYESLGRFIKRIPVNGIKTQIDISSLPSGIYMLRITNGDAVIKEAFVKR